MVDIHQYAATYVVKECMNLHYSLSAFPNDITSLSSTATWEWLNEYTSQLSVSWAVVAMAESRVYKEGPLEKRQRGLEHTTDKLKFQLRYFVLTTESLIYYKDGKVANTEI